MRKNVGGRVRVLLSHTKKARIIHPKPSNRFCFTRTAATKRRRVLIELIMLHSAFEKLTGPLATPHAGKSRGSGTMPYRQRKGQ